MADKTKNRIESTPEIREKARAARAINDARRAAFYAQIEDGELSVSAALEKACGGENALRRIRVDSLLKRFPGIGRKKADEILSGCKVNVSRCGQLGKTQIERIGMMADETVLRWREAHANR
jgi:hypothetical protein